MNNWIDNICPFQIFFSTTVPLTKFNNWILDVIIPLITEVNSDDRGKPYSLWETIVYLIFVPRGPTIEINEMRLASRKCWGSLVETGGIFRHSQLTSFISSPLRVRLFEVAADRTFLSAVSPRQNESLATETVDLLQSLRPAVKLPTDIVGNLMVLQI